MTPPLLPAHPWKTSYRHEDGDLVSLFYVPALECAVRYDRMTGYFQASALALAARGIEKLIANGGRMRLIVGCTLNDDEVKAIEAGYDLRQKVAEHLATAPLAPPDLRARGGLEALAWMISQGTLDVKVAVPVRPDGKPTAATGIYHEKVGIVEDAGGNRVSFSGSINETHNGWVNNRESFHLHVSWDAGRDCQHVADEVTAFARLWADQGRSVKVFDFPDAAKSRLLEFLPSDDRFVVPRHLIPGNPTGNEADGTGPVGTVAHKLLPDEVRRIVWGYIRHAARLKNGVRVGEATSTVSPWPHQTRTFKRMLDAWPCRLLLSDEVGLGKTISAGLLIRQAWLAGLARRILVLAPKAVLIQWQNELYEKFNLDVPIYDGQKLVHRASYGRQGPRERKADPGGWHREPFVLCSSHLMRRRERAVELLKADMWDLIVLDEAHHARRKSAGTPQEGGPNALLKLMHGLKDRCRALLLLTATPMQVAPVEVWDLLNLLGVPARWTSEAFVRYFEVATGNPSQGDLEFLAGMFRETEAGFGRVDEDLMGKILPDVSRLGRERVLKALRETGSGIPLKRLSASDRQAALETLRRFSPVRHRMSRHTRGLLRLYHQKGLLDTPVAIRDVSRDRPVEMTPAERALYDAVEEYISTTYNNAAADRRTAIGFVMTIYQRRLASSFHALKQTLNNHLAQIGGGPADADEEDLPQDETGEEVKDVDEAAAMTREALQYQEHDAIRDLLKRIAKIGGTDSKARRLKEELEAAFAAGFDSAIVFTQFTDTMDFLKEYLAAELPGVPLACYSGAGGQRRDHGGFWSSCTKEQIKLAFKQKSVKVLVCTDAAGEGLNFQFCGCLVNYDLPWNPMKVEQRIGRIDRIGQKYPVIRVVNLAYKDTVEADVYFSLGERINLFQGIVGKLQPILSRLPRAFEKVVLERKENREAARQRLVAEVGKEADAGGVSFDIDEVAVEALEMPTIPAPVLTPADIDRALNRADVRPPDMVWRPLDPGTYAVRFPGITEDLRAATWIDVFDDHPDNHVLLGPGGQLFDRLTGQGEPADGQAGDAAAHAWLVEPAGEVILLTTSGPQPVMSLGQLLDGLERLGEPGRPVTDGQAGSTLMPLG